MVVTEEQIPLDDRGSLTSVCATGVQLSLIPSSEAFTLLSTAWSNKGVALSSVLVSVLGTLAVPGGVSLVLVDYVKPKMGRGLLECN